MNLNPTFLVVNAIPNTEDMESFQSYIRQILPIFEKYGAKAMQRFQTIEQVMGTGQIKAMAYFEFPSPESIKEMVASEEFNALNDLRNKAYSQEVDLMICSAL